ncbi:MAG: lipid A deacylase LpxR family protein [Deltaproteobacteria bacterium]|nr:lipid A deacylase LpxR family protein [Deltaproteobacteria bacterium]
MSRHPIAIACLCLLCLCIRLEASPAHGAGQTLNLQFENDFFGGGTDRHFTHGTRVECVTKPIRWITDLADMLPWFSSERAESDPKEALRGRASISLGQNMYTPENTTATTLVSDDRPYAGWLYVGVGLAANQGSERYDKLELEIGVVGPASMAEKVQTFWHSLLGLQVPEGWDNQLHNEPGIVLYYEQALRLVKGRLRNGLKVDGVPHFGGAIGNVYTYGAAGFTVRLGSNLDDDFGPPRIRPSLPGSGFFQPGNGLSWYLFAGVEGRAVLRNIFLDGNTFRDSHSVDKKPLVGDLQAGLVFQWNRFRFSYTQILRTKEFDGQDRLDIFGSLTLSYHF